MKLSTLAAVPRAIGLWSGVSGAASRGNGNARILMLHGILRSDAAAFERAMRYVRRHFEVVPLRNLVADNVRLHGRLALTFDDGLRNNLEVAYPILRRLGLPATFFLCPQLIERGQWLWNHEARQRLGRLAPEARRELAGAGDVEAVVEHMKRIPLFERLSMEDQIRAATPGFVPTPEERHAFDLAGWDELRRLDPAVISIGSHTLTHPILPTLSEAEAEREIAQSRTVLEARLDRAVDTFAYPNGDLGPHALACVRRHYRAAVSVEEGQVAPGCDPHLLPRINVPRGVLRLALALHRDHLRVTPMSLSGSQVASSGNTVMSAMHTTIMKKKGSEASAT